MTEIDALIEKTGISIHKGENRMNFEEYCKQNDIELQPWQKEASKCFLKAMYSHRLGPSGKTFLINILFHFIREHGNTFDV